MTNTLDSKPVVKAEMMIRKPVNDVFQAFIEPSTTTKFWFTKSSGRLEKGKHVRWEWEMYGVSDNIFVNDIEENKRIFIESSDGTTVEWMFTPRNEQETMVSISNSGFSGNDDEIAARAIDSMGGYTMVLCGLKAYLEHNIILNLVLDKAPDYHI